MIVRTINSAFSRLRGAILWLKVLKLCDKRDYHAAKAIFTCKNGKRYLVGAEPYLMYSFIELQLKNYSESELALVKFRSILKKQNYSWDEKNYLLCYSDSILGQLRRQGSFGNQLSYKGNPGLINMEKIVTGIRQNFPISFKRKELVLNAVYRNLIYPLSKLSIQEKTSLKPIINLTHKEEGTVVLEVFCWDDFQEELKPFFNHILKSGLKYELPTRKIVSQQKQIICHKKVLLTVENDFAVVWSLFEILLSSYSPLRESKGVVVIEPEYPHEEGGYTYFKWFLE